MCKLVATVIASISMSGIPAGFAATVDERLPAPSSFLMPRGTEIALARSAAPARVSEDATILVLTESGYDTAVEGSNSFTCLVLRSFGNPTHAHAYLYDPGVVVPECLDENASRTILPMQLLRAGLAMRQAPPAEIEAAVREGFRSGRLQRTTTVSFSYMMSAAMTMSGGQPLTAHVMVYLPDDYSNETLGGFPFRERFVIVEGNADEPFVAANIYLPHKAIEPEFD